MSRTYAHKPEIKRKYRTREHIDKRIILTDFEIEYIEMRLGPTIRLR
jgi:hypothetical protein